jgi:glycerol-3-phosphate dehydrogenase
MKRIETDILVIGGGATGAGVAWDAALRGFRVVLAEKRDLTHGTTGRYHGLLHSGGRYVVKDPESALECIAENRILRRTHAQCIEDTSGFFVVTPEDEGDYPDRFQAACERLGVPCSEVPIKEALRREPMLNPRASRVFELPDGSADSFLSTHVTAEAARHMGAQILVYHEVTGLQVEGADGQRHVTGARLRDLAQNEGVEVRAAMTINAAGAWGGRVAAMAGVQVNVIPGKGTMVAMNHRIVNTVLNRCKMPSDGDIIVPVHTVAIIGTTDERVADPENLEIQAWEVQLLLEEGDKLVPGISNARVVRAWAGVRPLYQEHFGGASRDATRSLALLDHRERDGVSGFLTITGGKWTTFRLMAEKVMDRACDQLAECKPCLTASTSVPGVEQGHYWLGHRLAEVEADRLQNELVCECELVTRGMLENAVHNNPTLTIDDLRRDVRLGMGPCQGGYCAYRATSIVHEMMKAAARAEPPSDDGQERDSRVSWDVAYMQSPGHNTGVLPSDQVTAAVRHPGLDNPNLLLRDFIQERWKGQVPILWGPQLKQERMDEYLYLSLMNADHLPDEHLASPMSAFYAQTPLAADTEPAMPGAPVSGPE